LGCSFNYGILQYLIKNWIKIYLKTGMKIIRPPLFFKWV
jgi:hypothetical protein